MAGTGNKLDFGFGVFPYSYVSFAEMAELAKLGDALGYYALALPEHLLTLIGRRRRSPPNSGMTRSNSGMTRW
jgi:alkanesulfonate monooxygenase SsuD/methylene tetrahydromethanopterin reductase-like flavin-dependent oxidoreductase (luciferase family)